MLLKFFGKGFGHLTCSDSRREDGSSINLSWKRNKEVIEEQCTNLEWIKDLLVPFWCSMPMFKIEPVMMISDATNGCGLK